MNPLEEWIVEAGVFNKASLDMHRLCSRTRDVLIDQMTELVEAVAIETGNLDLLAGWAARLIVVAEGDGSEG